MFSRLRPALVGLLAAIGFAHAALADVPTSREYKVLLQPGLFASQPRKTSDDFIKDLKASLDSVGFDRKIKGDFAKSAERTVRFYDSPGSCRLRNLSYSFRERVEDGDRESTLKFRSTVLADAVAVTITGTSSQASSKLEMDATPTQEIYSRSTKQPFSKSKNLNKLKDVADLYPSAASLGLPGQEAMQIVGGLSVFEKVYEGPSSDLGQQDAAFSVTLWFLDEDDAAPVVAEASFKVKADDGDFTNKVTQRSQQMFAAMTQLSGWVAPNATPKTTWVYQYQPSFCNTASPSPQAGDVGMPF